jgi:hypothetical protein
MELVKRDIRGKESNSGVCAVEIKADVLLVVQPRDSHHNRDRLFRAEPSQLVVSAGFETIVVQV